MRRDGTRLRHPLGGQCPQRTEPDQQETGDPGDVDHVARVVLAALHEVREPAVGDGEREQAGSDQDQRGTPLPVRPG